MSRDVLGALTFTADTFGLVCGAALLSAALIIVLKPWLIRYALARPSARGLHKVPTPQGGGLAVLLACAAGASAAAWLFGLGPDDRTRLAVVLATAAVLGAIGLIDDIRPMPALPRLLLQLALMGVGVAALPDQTRVLPFLPLVIERALLVVGGTWFINLTNFMDGMDWMTVTEMVPVSLALVLFWSFGVLPPVAGAIALGLLGGLLGYAPFNKPVAKLFLGDVGSLPIGFLVAYGLFSLAGTHRSPGGSSGALAAAVLLPLYYIADSGITLLWRLHRREKVWEPHRNHFYQVAVAQGATVTHVLSRVFLTDIALVGLAVLALNGGRWLVLITVLAGIATVAITLRHLRSP